MPKVKRARSSRKSSGAKLDAAKSTISDLKKQVRKKVTRGQALSQSGKTTDLEAREIQIKIAALEHRVSRASEGSTKKTSALIEQRVQKQTEALRRKLKS